MLEAALAWKPGCFVVAGPRYPAGVQWPANVQRVECLPQSEHRDFYCAQRFTLNVMRQETVLAGYSPGVRLFEAAACGVPIISDAWSGLEGFFVPDEEILLARTADRPWAHRGLLLARSSTHRSASVPGLMRHSTRRTARSQRVWRMRRSTMSNDGR